MRTEDHGAQRIAGDVVESVEGTDVVLLQDAALDDGRGACAGLFGRLKKQYDFSLPWWVNRQRLGYSHQGCGMSVMTAGVHYPLMLRTVGERIFLCNRECIKICPQQCCFSGVPAINGTDNAMPTNPCRRD